MANGNIQNNTVNNPNNYNRNGWDRYQIMVLEKLDGHDKLLEKINDQIVDVKVEIATLKVKAGVWGAVAGAIPTIAALLFYLFKAF